MGKTFRNGNAISNAVMTVEPSIEGKCRIRRIDYDGTILGEEYVDAGSPMPTYPAPTPNDSRLTFNKWVTQTDSAAVQHDLDFGAIYDCNVEKTIGSTVVHPTILDCNFNSYTGLSPTIPIYITSGHPVYIDWGDGSEVDTVSATGTQSHTYEVGGNYSIMIYSDANWYFNTSSTVQLLGSYKGNNALLKCIIGKKIIRINSYMFYSNLALQSVVIPQGITDIFQKSFSSCPTLKSVIIPDSVRNISSNAFSGSGSLQSVVISKGVTNIQDYSFHSCHNLKSVIIPDSITNIVQYTFYESGVQFIVMPDSVTTLGSSLFDKCRYLQSSVIPNSVTTIGANVFSGCYSLTNLQLPLNWSKSIIINSCYNLSNDSLISLANRIADLSTTTAQNITLPVSVYLRSFSIFVDENGQRVPEGTAGAKTLVEFITDKNWTISA